MWRVLSSRGSCQAELLPGQLRLILSLIDRIYTRDERWRVKARLNGCNIAQHCWTQHVWQCWIVLGALVFKRTLMTEVFPGTRKMERKLKRKTSEDIVSKSCWAWCNVTLEQGWRPIFDKAGTVLASRYAHSHAWEWCEGVKPVTQPVWLVQIPGRLIAHNSAVSYSSVSMSYSRADGFWPIIRLYTRFISRWIICLG